MRSCPRQDLAGLDVIFLPDEQIAAEIGEQTFAVVDVGMIERGTLAKDLRIECLVGGSVVAVIVIGAILICEGLSVAFFPGGGVGGRR